MKINLNKKDKIEPEKVIAKIFAKLKNEPLKAEQK